MPPFRSDATPLLDALPPKVLLVKNTKLPQAKDNSAEILKYRLQALLSMLSMLQPVWSSVRRKRKHRRGKLASAVISED